MVIDSWSKQGGVKYLQTLFITGDMIMHEKQGFLNLETKLQDRLRYFMIALAVIQLLGLLIPGQAAGPFFTILAVCINLFILYFSFSIQRAPNFYFQLITWFFWFTIIFDGLDLYRILSGQQAFSLLSISSILSLTAALAIASTFRLYRTSINNVKKTAITS
jgi:hypothetical protein